MFGKLLKEFLNVWVPGPQTFKKVFKCLGECLHSLNFPDEVKTDQYLTRQRLRLGYTWC